MGLEDALCCGVIWWLGVISWDMVCHFIDVAVQARIDKETKPKTNFEVPPNWTETAVQQPDSSFIDSAMYLSMNDE